MAQEHEGHRPGRRPGRRMCGGRAFAGVVKVRDGKDPDGGHLTLTSEAFAALVRDLGKLR
ncbi:DUF397 domain-containing protein [Actinomadura madurae]|uniref:DUF397 domain-containing protein n=1 Tax=Actinomadura madurae TaxID=1993 RepID=UPI0009FB5FDA